MSKELKIKKENIQKLTVGHIFQNYKDMTEQLEIEFKKGGKSKQLQMESIRGEYFDFKKEGNKIIITQLNQKYFRNMKKKNSSDNSSVSIYSADIDKIKRISKGQVFNNYKQLTDFIGMKYPTGESKVRQMEFIKDSIFDYEIEGRKIIVKERYDIEDIQESMAMMSEGVTDMIEKMFLSLIVQHYHKSKKGSLVISKNFFARSVALINMSYKQLYDNSKRISKTTEIDEKNLLDFLNRHNSRINYLFQKTSQTLKRKYFVQTDVELYGVFNSKEDEIKHVDEGFRNSTEINLFGDPFEKKMKHNDEFSTSARLEEEDYGKILPISYNLENKIYQAEATILKEMGCSSDYEARKKGVYKEFREKSDAVMSHMFGLKFYFKAYRVNYHKGILDDNVDMNQFKLEPHEELLLSKQINEYTKKSTISNAKKRMERDKQGFNTQKFERKIDKSFQDYKTMAELYIDNVKDREIMEKEIEKSKEVK